MSIAPVQVRTDPANSPVAHLPASRQRMEYNQFSVIELAADPSFVGWVQRPDAANDAFWAAFLTQNPDRAEVVTEAHHLVMGWRIDSPEPAVGSMAEVWTKIQVDIDTTPQYPILRVNWFSGRHSPFMRYAAVFVGVLLMAAGYVWLRGSWTETHYATGRGETKTVHLPDGSTVVLAANSSVAVVGDWTPEHPRELTLQGEAFFSVTHQPNHRKFIVKTANNLRVEVRGTTFTITERATKTQVVLNSGQIALYVGTTTRPLVMKPGELVDVPRIARQPVVRRHVEPEVYSAWKDNRFVFDDTSLGEIATLIEREFGDTVRFSNESLKDLRITVRLPDRNLDLLLMSLAEIHDLAITRQENRVEIAPMPVVK